MPLEATTWWIKRAIFLIIIYHTSYQNARTCKTAFDHGPGLAGSYSGRLANDVIFLKLTYPFGIGYLRFSALANPGVYHLKLCLFFFITQHVLVTILLFAEKNLFLVQFVPHMNGQIALLKFKYKYLFRGILKQHFLFKTTEFPLLIKKVFASAFGAYKHC